MQKSSAVSRITHLQLAITGCGRVLCHFFSVVHYFLITNRHWTEHRQHFITHKPNAHDNINARLKGIAIADSTLAGYWMLMLASALMALRRFRYDINVAFVVYERWNAFWISLFSTEVCNSGHTCGLLWAILLTQTLYRYSSTFREILMLLFNTNFTEEKK